LNVLIGTEGVFKMMQTKMKILESVVWNGGSTPINLKMK